MARPSAKSTKAVEQTSTHDLRFPMNKSIAVVEQELGWYADQQAIDGKAAALAGIAMLHAVREFDKSSSRVATRMLWLTVAIGVLTAGQITVGVWSVLSR
jgi:hypothetical protein